jgi:hypothetical protein
MTRQRRIKTKNEIENCLRFTGTELNDLNTRRRRRRTRRRRRRRRK